MTAVPPGSGEVTSPFSDDRNPVVTPGTAAVAELQRLTAYMLDRVPAVVGEHPNVVDAAIYMIGGRALEQETAIPRAAARGASMVSLALTNPAAHMGIIQTLETEGVELALEYLRAAAAHSVPAFLAALGHTVMAFLPAVDAPALNATLIPLAASQLASPAVTMPPQETTRVGRKCPTCEREGMTDNVTLGCCDACGNPLPPAPAAA